MNADIGFSHAIRQTRAEWLHSSRPVGFRNVPKLLPNGLNCIADNTAIAPIERMIFLPSSS
jgi:hypothetical protein